jgi:ribosomal-protein-alanine N-acetyltransferase
MTEFELVTARLVLRSWRPSDRPPFATMNADPEVMEFFPAPLTRAESDTLVERFEGERVARGFCPWAVEERASGAFIGFVGLHQVPEYLPCAPAVEVGWRLARPFWGRGYATEAATAAVDFAFDTLHADEVVSFTSTVNVRSRAVMERLSMTRRPAEDFDHPHVVQGHPLRPHVLYRLGAAAWRGRVPVQVQDVRYRRATEHDVEAIAGLHAESWRQNYRGAYSDSFLDGHVLADRVTVWTDRLTHPHPDRITFVAEHRGEVVGFAHTVFDDHPTWGALLDNLHVARSAKRRGIGRHLMARAAAAVVERTPSTGLSLWVLEQNTAAQAFYEALGGTCVEHGVANAPDGGHPPRLRYAWSDPAALLAGS